MLRDPLRERPRVGGVNLLGQVAQLVERSDVVGLATRLARAVPELVRPLSNSGSVSRRTLMR